MTRCSRWLALAVCFLAAFSVAGAALQAEEYTSPVEKLELQDGDCVVFLGDSITHQCLYTQYVEDYFYTRFPKMRIKFHNAGVGGAKALDALARFKRDVADYKPKYVTVLLGMNDGTYRPYDDATFQTYRNGMTELIAEIKNAGAIPVLMTPTMYDSRAARMAVAADKEGKKKADPERFEFYNSTLAYYGAWLREVALENGCGFVDMYSPLNNLTLEARENDPKFTMIKDAVHPDEPGQFVMAFSLLHDLEVPQIVSEIRIAKKADGDYQAESKGGGVTALASAGPGLEFNFAAESLPWVVPAAAQPAAQMLYAGHRLGRESLAIDGLTPGKYDLAIDKEVVGTYTAAELAQGIELENNSKTPQYQQAARIAELNDQRNGKTGPVHLLRNEWSQMQLLYRQQAQFKADPNNAELKGKLDAQTKKTEGIEARIAAHEQAAKEIEDKIFASNQPLIRRYQITPAK